MNKGWARWPMFERVERRARRTQDMIERLNVDVLKLIRLRRGEAYNEARERCLKCVSADKCLYWLESDQPPDAVPDFCPNLKAFLECQASTKKTNDTDN